MDLVAPSTDYDSVSEKVREYAASRLYEMIEATRPFVSEALSDPAGIHDTEPGRITAFAGLIKLQTAMIRELGMLYRVQQPPREDTSNMITAAQMELLLLEAAARQDRAVAEAAEAAREAVLAEVATRDTRSLVEARESVSRALSLLAGR